MKTRTTPRNRTSLNLAMITALSIGLASCAYTETKSTETKNNDSANASKPEVRKELPVKQQTAGKTPPIVTPEMLEIHSAEQKRRQKVHYSNNSTLALMSPGVVRQPLRQNDVQNTENYAHFDDQGVMLTTRQPVSTFSIDVDTGSYTNVRRMLRNGQLPPKDAVRPEEFINYFNYQYDLPESLDQPFSVQTEMMPSPWSKDSYLLQIGIQAYDVKQDQRPNANLVFLIDVSGSMNSANKLGLLKKSLSMLTRKMTKNDKVSIVVYAGASGVVLEPTDGNQTLAIEAALSNLKAGGSTNGAAGIQLAYQMAEKSFIKDGINRIMLATDGDFNVGTTNFNSLMELVEQKRKTGIALSTLGFGSGNYNDHLMEQLADQGNGQYNYIDSVFEAKKVLVDEISSSLLTVANDVKIQMEFNPQQVAEYRLIGYENRALKREDFNNDKVDAGEIGAGHTVTALYEIRFTDSSNLASDPLRYQNNDNESDDNNSASSIKNNELGYLKLRYKNPDEDTSRLIKTALLKSELMASSNQPSENIQFAATVAGFAQQLRGGEQLSEFGYAQIIKLAKSSKGKDTRGLRAEFLQLVEMSELLTHASEKH